MQYINDYTDYYLGVVKEARKQFGELHDVNTEEFFEKHDQQ